MGRVLSNNTTLQIAREPTLGEQPTTGWYLLEPTNIGKFGASITKLTRMPISKNRQRRKGSPTDLDASVEFEHDTTYSFLRLVLEPLMFASLLGTPLFYPSAVTATGFIVSSGGAVADGTLFHVKGCKYSENNGLHIAAGTSTGTEIKCTGLVAETGLTARGVTLEVCGIRGANGDLEIDADGNLISTVFNWTTGVASGIQPGQFLWIGYEAAHANSFAQSVNRGFRRVIEKSANKITLDRETSSFVEDDGAGKQIYILFGQYIRNYPVDDPNYLEPSTHLELAYENLGTSPSSDKYEYTQGGYLNEITLDLPTTSKATVQCNFIGLDCKPPTITRATGAGSSIPPVGTTMYNTSTDFLRLRAMNYDETGNTTYFKSINFKITNNVSGEKVLAKLGSAFMNAGEFDLDISAKVLFTDSTILEAIRNNVTMTLEVGIRNDDGGFIFDVPAMTVEDGKKEFPLHQTVNLDWKAIAFQDPRLGYSLGVSTFPHLPAA